MSFTYPDVPMIPETAAYLRPQVGALCWRMRRGRVQVLLITSRDTRRWILPKGWLMDGKLAHEAAEIEAWEEAGAVGQISETALGLYVYDKLHPAKPAQRCEVAVYPLRISRLEGKFPEKGQRQRKWLSAQKAARLVAEVQLHDLLLVADKVLAKAKV